MPLKTGHLHVLGRVQIMVEYALVILHWQLIDPLLPAADGSCFENFPFFLGNMRGPIRQRQHSTPAHHAHKQALNLA